MIAQIVQDKMAEIHDLCRKYHVEKMWLFGSAVTPEFGPESDLDLIIDIDPSLAPEDAGENYFAVYYALKKLFAREIDMVSHHSMRNPYFIQELDRTKRLIYAAA